MEVKHQNHYPGKIAKPRGSAKIKGPYKRKERMIKDEALLEQLRCNIQNGGTQGIFHFERTQEQENLLKTFQEGNFFLCRPGI